MNMRTAYATVMIAFAVLLISAGGAMSADVNVGVVITFPDNTTLVKCVSLPKGSDGKAVLEHANISLNGSFYNDWGFLLTCVNGICSPPGGKWYWSFHLIKKGENNWTYMPAGLGPGGENNSFCWNRDYTSFGGHYCAIDGDVIGIGNGYNARPTFYGFSEICGSIKSAISRGVGWIAKNQEASGKIRGDWIWDDCFALWLFYLYDSTETIKNKNDLLTYVKSMQNNNAGWGPAGDVDSTGVCLYGLSVNGVPLNELKKNGKTPADEIKNSQGKNGGFSSWNAENVQSTAWGMIGLGSINELMPAEYGKTPIDYLTSAQNGDGSWEYVDPIYDTSTVLIALKSARAKANDTMVSRALGFILSQQKPDGRFCGNDFYNALALIALEKWNDGGALDESISKGVDYLVSRQRDNGGFARDDETEPRGTVTSLCLIAIMGGQKEVIRKEALSGGGKKEETAHDMPLPFILTIPVFMVIILSILIYKRRSGQDNKKGK